MKYTVLRIQKISLNVPASVAAVTGSEWWPGRHLAATTDDVTSDTSNLNIIRHLWFAESYNIFSCGISLCKAKQAHE